MRDYAIDLLRDEVETDVISSADRAGAPRKAGPGLLNPFALGIPFMLLGVLLTPLFGLVGLALAAIGALMCVVGLLLALARSRSRPPEGGG